MNASAPTALDALLLPGWRAMKRSFVPGLVLQAFALALVLAYYQAPSTRASFDQVAEWKQAGGTLFAAGSTALFGGVLPFLLLLRQGAIGRERRLAELTFFTLFWFWKGAEIDTFYRLQEHWFGAGNAARVIAQKTAIDQFVYNPLWAAPTQTLFFLWKDQGFSFARTQEALRERPLWLRSATVLLTTWVVWIPAVSIIYTLPGALQLPLFNLVLCFWCVLLTFLSRNASEPVP